MKDKSRRIKHLEEDLRAAEDEITALKTVLARMQVDISDLKRKDAQRPLPMGPNVPKGPPYTSPGTQPDIRFPDQRRLDMPVDCDCPPGTICGNAYCPKSPRTTS